MKTFALGVAAAILSVGAVGSSVSAEPTRRPSAEGRACVRAGKALLRENRIVRDAARRRIDWAQLDPTGAGLLGLPAGSIRIELGDVRRLSLGRLLVMHLRSPEVFAWCDAPSGDGTPGDGTSGDETPDEGTSGDGGTAA